MRNGLLAKLPLVEYERILPHLEPIGFKLGKVIYESGEQMNHIYFPTTSIISLLYVTENGASAEIGIIGNEGLAPTAGLKLANAFGVSKLNEYIKIRRTGLTITQRSRMPQNSSQLPPSVKGDCFVLKEWNTRLLVTSSHLTSPSD